MMMLGSMEASPRACSSPSPTSVPEVRSPQRRSFVAAPSAATSSASPKRCATSPVLSTHVTSPRRSSSRPRRHHTPTMGGHRPNELPQLSANSARPARVAVTRSPRGGRGTRHTSLDAAPAATISPWSHNVSVDDDETNMVFDDAQDVQDTYPYPHDDVNAGGVDAHYQHDHLEHERDWGTAAAQPLRRHQQHQQRHEVTSAGVVGGSVQVTMRHHNAAASHRRANDHLPQGGSVVSPASAASRRALSLTARGTVSSMARQLPVRRLLMTTTTQTTTTTKTVVHPSPQLLESVGLGSQLMVTDGATPVAVASRNAKARRGQPSTETTSKVTSRLPQQMDALWTGLPLSTSNSDISRGDWDAEHQHHRDSHSGTIAGNNKSRAAAASSKMIPVRSMKTGSTVVGYIAVNPSAGGAASLQSSHQQRHYHCHYTDDDTPHVSSVQKMRVGAVVEASPDTTPQPPQLAEPARGASSSRDVGDVHPLRRRVSFSSERDDAEHHDDPAATASAWEHRRRVQQHLPSLLQRQLTHTSPSPPLHEPLHLVAGSVSTGGLGGASGSPPRPPSPSGKPHHCLERMEAQNSTRPSPPQQLPDDIISATSAAFSHGSDVVSLMRW